MHANSLVHDADVYNGDDDDDDDDDDSSLYMTLYNGYHYDGYFYDGDDDGEVKTQNSLV